LFSLDLSLTITLGSQEQSILKRIPYLLPATVTTEVIDVQDQE
ncbi:hypothetical protein T06_17040, partial [Trichinella sp. T6]